MVSKVEELRKKLLEETEGRVDQICGEFCCGDSDQASCEKEIADTKADLDSLISTAHAEGVAEGAERERERIRDIVCPDEDEHGDLTIGWLSLSVLAPTKETP